MKKTMIVILMLLLIISVSGCADIIDVSDNDIGNNGTVNGSKETSAVTDGDEAEENGILVRDSVREVEQGVGFGEEKKVYLSDVTEIAFIDGKSEAESGYPVFIDKYPLGMAGELYEMTAELKDDIEDNLREFLKLYYGVSDVGDYELSDDPVSDYHVCYVNEGVEISSSPSQIYVITNTSNVTREEMNGSISDNALLDAALRYAGINDPQVLLVTDNDAEGKPYSYTYNITECSDGSISNSLQNSLNYVTVHMYENYDNVSILIKTLDATEKADNFEFAPYDEAFTYISDHYEVDDSTDVLAQVFYSSKVQEGYLIPCYRFYVKTEQNGIYRIVDVTNAG